MTFAYADPPYIGCAKLYKDQESYVGEVDHKALLNRLYYEYPDGWALSCHSPSLWDIIPMVPKEWKCRVAAWCKPWASFKPNVNPAYAWEPVIWRGGREHVRIDATVRDYVSCSVELKIGLVGAKPDEFCYWLFALLNMQPDDTFVDLYPGTGRVTRAWERWRDKMPLFSEVVT